MPDEKGNEVSKRGLSNLEREWMNHQRQSQYVQDAQRREVGILRDAKSGPEFYRYVTDELGKATDKTACADNIARELSKDNRYLINAATNLDGRRGLEALRAHISYDDQGKALLGNIDKALGLTRNEPMQNRKNFQDNFPKFEAELKKQLESQGIEVNKAYYKKFTEYQVEIRTEVREFVKGVKVERMDGGSERIYTGTRDILVGGYDYDTGKFVPPSTMEKHGTAESSFIQGDDILFVAIAAARKTAELAFRQIGKGLAREAVDLAKVAGRDALKTVSKEGGRDVGKLLSRGAGSDARKSAEGAMDTVEDLSKTIRREKPPKGGRGGEVRRSGDAADDTIRDPKTVEAHDTAEDMGDTLDKAKLEKPSSGESPPPGGLSKTKEPSPYPENEIAIIGEDAAKKARDAGITPTEMHDYLKDKVWKAGKIDDDLRLWAGLARDDAGKVAREELNNVSALGKDTSRRLMDYGYSPTNLSDAVKAGKAQGLPIEQIRKGLNNEAKLMDHLKNNYCGGDIKKARVELRVAENPRVAIQNNIFGDRWNEWKLRNPRYDELPTEVISKEMGKISDKAAEMAKNIEKRLLDRSVTPLALPIIAAALKGDRSSDSQKKEKDGKKERSPEQGKDGSNRDSRGTASTREKNASERKQSEEQQKSSKKDSEERELRKAAEKEVGSSAPKDSRERESGEGKPSGEDKEKERNRE